jgi:hypothetical protein
MALAKVNSARSLVTSSSCSYLRKPSTCAPVSLTQKLTACSSKRTRTLENARRVYLLRHCLIRNNREELVVGNDRLSPLASTFRCPSVNSTQPRRTHRIILHAALYNQVDDTGRIRKRGHVLANLVDGEDQILAQVAG